MLLQMGDKGESGVEELLANGTENAFSMSASWRDAAVFQGYRDDAQRATWIRAGGLASGTSEALQPYFEDDDEVEERGIEEDDHGLEMDTKLLQEEKERLFALSQPE